MKKSTIHLFNLVLGIILLFACKKDDTGYNAYFYMKSGSPDAQYGLYLDGTYKGDLPVYNLSTAEFGDSLKSKVINIYLKSGSYKIEAKDHAGNIKNSSKLKFSKTKISSGGTMGGTEIMQKGDQMVIALF